MPVVFTSGSDPTTNAPRPRRRGGRMKRRAFVGLICGATAAWSIPARAQRSGKMRIIGFLGTNTASVQEQWTAAFVERLRQLGWTEGGTVTGLTNRSAGVVAERLDLLGEIVSGLQRLAIIANAGNPDAAQELEDVQAG